MSEALAHVLSVPKSTTITAAANDHAHHTQRAERAFVKKDLSLFQHHLRMATTAARTFEMLTKPLDWDGLEESDKDIEECPPCPSNGANPPLDAEPRNAPKASTIQSSAPDGANSTLSSPPPKL